MNLYPIYYSPKTAAMSLADIHINTSIEFSVRILNTILHRIHGSASVDVVHCANGEIDYSIKGIKILAPLWKKIGGKTSTAKWVDWTEAHFKHYWWVYTNLWYLNKERMHRFVLPAHADWKLAENWHKAHLFHILPREEKQGDVDVNLHSPDYFPTTHEVIPHLNPASTGVNDAYQAYYKELLKGTKARWTNREVPDFWKPSTALVIVK